MINQINVEISSSQPLLPNIALQAKISPAALSEAGFVFPVTVQTPSFLCVPPFFKTLKTVTVMALLDTGTLRTSVSDVIATALELKPVGFSKMNTAAGVKTFPDYIIDILFANNGIKGFADLMVGSCSLPYNNNPPNGNVMAKSNFGVLIGRDIMSHWNIVWNGPTSSVFIAD